MLNINYGHVLVDRVWAGTPLTTKYTMSCTLSVKLTLHNVQQSRRCTFGDVDIAVVVLQAPPFQLGIQADTLLMNDR